MKTRTDIPICLNSKGGRGGGYNDLQPSLQDRVYDPGGTAPAITSTFTQRNIMEKKGQTYRIRELTERECFRLMDVKEQDIDKIQATGLSKRKQIALAGNSIVVAVLAGIFDRLFISKEPQEQQLKLF